MTTTHELKLWTVFFEDTYRKPFELRRNDRGFQVGDRLHLREWDKDAQAYTGRECMREVIYVLPEGSPGLAEGHVGLGLGPWFGVPRPATVDETERGLAKRIPNTAATDLLPPGFPGLLSATLIGSRVTCNPPPADTDLDVLVLVSDVFEAQSCLTLAGFGHDGSEVSNHHDSVFDSAFRSYSNREVNVILTDDEEFHSRFLAASSVAKRLNLLQKGDRVALFQAVLYGNACGAL